MGLLALLVTLTAALSAQPPKADPPKDAKPVVVKLPDGTFLWLGPADGEKVQLTPQEYQKLLDRADALKKELAARKPAPPSGCAVRGRVEKRGEQLVAALKLTYSFRTTQPNAAVSLGGKKTFLVSAALDGTKLPVLDTAEDGFAVTVEAAGDHSLTLDVEAPINARGAKEIGFDLGLPRAPITTLALDPPADVKRVTVATRTPDTPPGKDTRRTIDVKQLATKPPDAGLPLGPADSLELTWEPPAAATGGDAVRSAELDVAAVLSEGFVDSTARAKFRGPGREWKLVAPATADVTVARAATGDTGAAQPVVTKPADPNKPVWKIELPADSAAADWTATAVVRHPRSKGEGKAVPVGPFAVLDVLRQTGTVKVTAGPYTRFAFKHGPDLRRDAAPGPEDVTAALFHLATGPTGAAPPGVPLLTVEAWPIEGAVRVKPTYKLRLTEAGWVIRAEVAVKPVRTEVTELAIDVPAEWRGLESESDPDTVEGVAQSKAEGAWRPVTVRLAGGLRQPFALVFVATLPVAPGSREQAFGLPRFPKAVERETTVSATVSDGLEVRGTAYGWDGDQPASWGAPLAAVAGPDGKPPKVAAAVSGRGERGLSRVALAWQPHRPDAAAEIRTEVTVGERQVVVSQAIKLRAPDGFSKPVRFRGPPEALGLKSAPALTASEVKVSFALPLPERLDAPVSVPIGLLWPAEVARVESTVRVWVNATTGRAVATSAGGWRELPPEPMPDRDALPALTLAAGAEHPLVLEVRPAAPESAASVWVERTLIEAGVAEDGSVSYRARFRLARWLVPAVEVTLPAGTGPAPVVRVDGLSVTPAPAGDGRLVRVPLPEAAPGRSAVVDIQYTLPGVRMTFGETAYQPPRLAAAAYSGPVRWLVVEPTDAAPLLFSNRGRAELRWRLRVPAMAPSAAGRGAADRWFATGAEPGPDDVAPRGDGEPLAVRQSAPEPVRVFRLPWLVLVAAGSLAAFLALLAPTWLPARAAAFVVALVGGAAAVAAVLYPQPSAQAAAAAQPGLAVGLFALAIQTLARWRVRRRVVNLPGFTRAPALPSTPSAGTPSVRSRPGSGGSGTPAPAAVAPSGS